MRITKKNRIMERWVWFLLFCVAVAVITCVSQIRGSMLLLYGSLFLFLSLCVLAFAWNYTGSYFLFFLPWSPLLKLYSGAISFYTVALLISCLLYLVKNRYKLNRYQFYLGAILFCLTLIGKAIQGNSLTNSYIFFFIMLLLFPCVARNTYQHESFYSLTIFLSFGIISAALIAQQVAGYPNISKYITVQSYLRITRLSGFFGDPNFYSAHITAALSGLLLLLSREEKRAKQLFLIVVGVILIYCGLLSASKMFIAVMACEFLFWIPVMLRKKGGWASKLSLLLGFLCAGIVILSSVAFRELFTIVDIRFSYASNVSKLTTGRTELWWNYMKELSQNLLLFLFGQGYSQVVLDGKASHNTLIQMIYQFGISGSLILMAWVCFTQRMMSVVKTKRSGSHLLTVFMLIGVVLPWMSLDILFFDEFFLLTIYATIGVLSMTDRTTAPSDRFLFGAPQQKGIPLYEKDYQ